MTDCPAEHYIDSSDWSEPEQCELPLEHNVDGAWHQASWKTDVEEVSVRWAPEIGEHSRWPKPPYVGPDPELLKRITSLMLHPSVFERIPVAPPVVAVMFRKWAPLSLATAQPLEEFGRKS